jgi:hypothetical protein
MSVRFEKSYPIREKGILEIDDPETPAVSDGAGRFVQGWSVADEKRLVRKYLDDRKYSGTSC